jgi:hypothetical protein
MTPTPPRRQETPVDQLGQVLAHLPAGYSLVPSQIYYFFVVDRDGSNKGYVTEGGEVRWWASGEETHSGRHPVPLPTPPPDASVGGDVSSALAGSAAS